MLTNTTDIPLGMALWLAVDEYDFVPESNSISATGLLKSVRQIVLSSRVDESTTPRDISNNVSSKVGNAIHNDIENAWANHYQVGLANLGYPQKMIDKIRINPTEPEEGTIPVYLEHRGNRKINDFNVSAKFDLVINGELNDTKNTSTFTAKNNTKEEDYRLQGSIYRWVHQDKITSDHITINWLFTDWKRSMVNSHPDYPKAQCQSFRVELLSLAETEHFITSKLNDIVKYYNAPESELPHCTPKELWQSDPVYKYYSNPANTAGRATKNFDNHHDAIKHQTVQGKGVVVAVPGQPKACGYCKAFELCRQKDLYNA